MLRDAGVPLLFDDDHNVYRIPGTYYLPPTNFTTEEALAVMVLCYELGRSQRLPFYEAAQNAALKLEASLPGRVREQLQELTDAVQIKLEAGAIRWQDSRPSISNCWPRSPRGGRCGSSTTASAIAQILRLKLSPLPDAVQPPQLVRDRPLGDASRSAHVQRGPHPRARAARRRIHHAARTSAFAAIWATPGI